MTGEVTLQGRVLPIGGLKQKVMAAQAAGLTEVILPKRNEADLDDLPADGSELLEKFLLTLDRQAQINEAGRIVARYLELRHPAGPLIRTLVRAVVREDANFHTYQMLDATVQQHQEWGDTEQGGHILLAGARYIAAHSPTQREMLQTAEIVQRLHRGEDLHEQGGLSRYY